MLSKRDFLLELKDILKKKLDDNEINKIEYNKTIKEIDKIIENCINYSSEYEFY